MTERKGTLNRPIGYLKSRCTKGKARLDQYCQRVLDETVHRLRFSKKHHGPHQLPVETDQWSNRLQEGTPYDENRRAASSTLLSHNTDEPTHIREVTEVEVAIHKETTTELAHASAAYTTLNEAEVVISSSTTQATPVTAAPVEVESGGIAEVSQSIHNFEGRARLTYTLQECEQILEQHRASVQEQTEADVPLDSIYEQSARASSSQEIHNSCLDIKHNVIASLETEGDAEKHHSPNSVEFQQAEPHMTEITDEEPTSNEKHLGSEEFMGLERPIHSQEPNNRHNAPWASNEDEDIAPCKENLVLGPDEEINPTSDAMTNGEDRDGSLYDNDEGLRQFKEVLDALNLEALEKVALQLRQSQLRESGSKAVISSCEADPYPLHGSYNLVAILTFDDGVEWIARVPGYGASPSALQIEKMDLEYRTMEYIRSKTSFKMPEVYYWSTSTNEVGTLFGLISLVEGVSLWECWQDIDFDEQKRMTAIAGVASEMAKLYPLQFDKTGMLRFDADDEASHVDYEIESWGTHDKAWGRTRKHGPFKNYSEWIDDHMPQLSCRKEPRDLMSPISNSGKVKIMIESTPDLMRNVPLSLCLPDADFQNILCDPTTGQITGFIDMDNIRVAPVVIGSAAFPRFLVKDRCPTLYAQDVRMSDMLYTLGDFRRYRKYYAKCFRDQLPVDIPYDPRWTDLSDRTMALEDAVWSDSCEQFDFAHDLAWTAYFNVYSDRNKYRNKVEALEDMLYDDMFTRHPLYKHRFKSVVRKGLWKTERDNIPQRDSYLVSRDEEAARNRARARRLQETIDQTIVVLGALANSQESEAHASISSTPIQVPQPQSHSGRAGDKVNATISQIQQEAAPSTTCTAGPPPTTTASQSTAATPTAPQLNQVHTKRGGFKSNITTHGFIRKSSASSIGKYCSIACKEVWRGIVMYQGAWPLVL